MQKSAIAAAPNAASEAVKGLVRQRLLHYMQALPCSPAEAEQLAEQALAQALQSQAEALLPAALNMLQELLAQRLPLPTVPSPQRQSMYPEPLQRGLLQDRRDRRPAPGRFTRLRPLLLQHLYLLGVLAALLVLAYLQRG